MRGFSLQVAAVALGCVVAAVGAAPVGSAPSGATPGGATSRAAAVGVSTGEPGGITIRSQDGWQATGLDLRHRQEFSVEAVGGTWTVDGRTFEHVGPDGYSPHGDARIWQGCKVLSGEPYGKLLGRVGGDPFAVGSGGQFRAPSEGRLELRINDDNRCLGDNVGSIAVNVTPARPTDTIADALAAAINYLCPDLDTPQGASDCVELLQHLFNGTRCVAALATATVDVTGTQLASILVSDECSSVLIEGVRQLVELVKCARMYGLAECVGRQPGQITPAAWDRQTLRGPRSWASTPLISMSRMAA